MIKKSYYFFNVVHRYSMCSRFSCFFSCPVIAIAKMYIKSTSYVHVKSANRALNLVLFYALELMLIPNANSFQLAPNKCIICTTTENLKKKDAGTKMHNC